MNLTTKQRAFVLEVLKDGNATQAAIRAGYSARTAHAIGWENLRKPEILAAVAEARDAIWDAEAMGVKETHAELSGLARANMGDYFYVTEAGEPILDLRGLDRRKMAAIKSIKVEDFVDRRERDAGGNVIARDVRRIEITLHDKRGALTTLARINRMLVDRVEVAPAENFAEMMEAAARRAAG